MLELKAQHAALLPVLRSVFDQFVTSGRYILGPHVEAFERNLAGYCGAAHAVGVSSGTDALLVSLMALGVGPGDEVVTTPLTFYATAGCIARVGARPVFADIDPVTFNVDPAALGAALGPKTRAVIPVHLYGQAADMEPIVAAAKRRGVPVIEDAAQAIGARDGDRPVGSIGDVGCFSFYPTKNLAALGDAGACTTQDPQLAQRLRALRVHGEDSKYHHAFIGGNFRLDAIQAAVLNVKFAYLRDWTDARRAAAKRYHDLLQGLPIVLPGEAAGKYHVYNQYTIRVLDGQRDALRERLRGCGIGQEVYYPVPLHLQPCFTHLGGKPGQFPRAERAAREVLSLPIYPGIPPAHQERVAAAVRGYFQ